MMEIRWKQPIFHRASAAWRLQWPGDPPARPPGEVLGRPSPGQELSTDQWIGSRESLPESRFRGSRPPIH